MQLIAVLEKGWFVELLIFFTFPFFSWRTNEKELVTEWTLKYPDIVSEECFFLNKFCWRTERNTYIFSINLNHSKQQE